MFGMNKQTQYVVSNIDNTVINKVEPFAKRAKPIKKQQYNDTYYVASYGPKPLVK